VYAYIGPLWVIVEYCEHGSLRSYLRIVYVFTARHGRMTLT